MRMNLQHYLPIPTSPLTVTTGHQNSQLKTK